MADQSAAIKMADTKTKINKAVNRKYSKSQPVEKCILDEGWIDQYYFGFGKFFGAVWTVLYIVPALVIGLLDGLSHGFLKGLQKATSTHEKRVSR
jgi:hypothetical protein